VDRRTFLRAGLGGAGAWALAACSKDRGAVLRPTGPKPAATRDLSQRQTLRLAGGDFGFPSPFSYQLGPGYGLMMYMYDALLSVDVTGKLVPWLASSYQRSADGLVYTFELRQNVHWHDGKPLTSDDVVFTFDYHERQKKQGKLSPTLILQPEHIAKVSALSPQTVQIRLTKPAITFASVVAGAVPIIPKHVWSSIDDAAKAQDPKLLVGTGPYRLGSYESGTGSYLYTANDDFYLGKPYINRIESIPAENPPAALLAGAIDAGSPAINGSTTTLLRRFRRDPSFGILEGEPGGFLSALYFNLRKGGPTADRRFRQAVAYAIDRQDLVKRLLGGLGEPGNPGFLPRSHAYYAQVEQYPFSRAKANALLDEAGYLRRGDGVRKGPDGKQLVFELLAPPINGPLIELVHAQLKQVGIQMDIKPVENFVPYAAMPKGEFETTVVVYGNPGGDPDRMRELYSSRLPDEGRLPFAAYGYSDPEFDDLADRQLVTVDETERKKLVARMQEIVARDVPFLHLVYPRPILIYRNGIFDGLSLKAGGGGPFTKDFFVTGKRTPA